MTLHKYNSHNGLLETVLALNLVLSVKAEECKLVALASQGVLKMDIDSGHKGFEAAIIDILISLDHDLHAMVKTKRRIEKNLIHYSISCSCSFQHTDPF